MTGAAFSGRFLDYVVSHGCMPPGRSADELRAALRERGVEPPEPLLRWETALHETRDRAYLPRAKECREAAGGCRCGNLGALLQLPSGARFSVVEAIHRGQGAVVRQQDGASLILFGSSRYGGLLYMDPQGSVFHAATPGATGACKRVAASPFVYVEREVLTEMTTESVKATLRCETEPSRLAEALGVPPAAQASDDLARYHVDERFVLAGFDPGEAFLRILRIDGAAVERVVGALARLGVRARLVAPHPTFVYEPLSSAPPLEAPAAPHARLWTFGRIEGWVAAAKDRDGAPALAAIEGRGSKTRELVVSDGKVCDTRRTCLGESALGEFSKRCREYLLAAKVRRDPVEIPQDDELRELLSRWGLRSYPALEEASAHWSGLTWGLAATEDAASRLGTFAVLLLQFPDPRRPLAAEPAEASGGGLELLWQGRELVIVGGTDATTMFLDHDGSVVEHDAASGQVFLSAGSLRTRIEFEAALAEVSGARHQIFEAAVVGSVGEALARGSGIPAVPEASDSVRSWWIGEHASINELHSPLDGERQTAIFAQSEQLLEEMMARARSLASRI